MSLRSVIKHRSEELNVSLGDLTVMSGATDPYRIDTPAYRRDAAWLRQAWEAVGSPTIHLRGLHYALVSTEPKQVKPDGTPYLNTDDDWAWLQSTANRARWLGEIPFTAILDERNAPPRNYTGNESWPTLGVGHNAHALRPTLPDSLGLGVSDDGYADTHLRQAYRLVLIGEKASLGTVLAPVAEQFEAELVLPTGELSTTLLYGIVQRAAYDGRPCRIFYFSDFDPAGYHMAVEVSRKVQALVDLEFEGLDIQLRRTALTAEQVIDLGLPETPLKESERRAARWRERFGAEQTEIDALATLRPGVLADIALEALAPFWDDTLADRVRQARDGAEATTNESIAEVEAAHEAELQQLRVLMEQAAKAATLAHDFALPLLETMAGEVEVTQPEMPEAEPEGEVDTALFCSGDDWPTATLRLIKERL